MKFLVSSDLHAGPTPDEVIVNGMARHLTKDLDAVLLAGDLVDARGPVGFATQDALVKRLEGKSMLPLGYVMGNHDFWANNGKKRYAAWQNYMAVDRRDSHSTHLEQNNLYLPDQDESIVAVVGTAGWYDYSAADANLGHDKTWYANNKSAIMVDGRYMEGWPSDEDLSRTFRETFTKRLRKASLNPRVSRIVVVTHVPVFEEQMERRPGDYDWSVGNAYFGNFTLGDVIKAFPKVKLVVSGHTHVAKDVHVDGIHAVVVGSDYGSPAWLTLEV